MPNVKRILISAIAGFAVVFGLFAIAHAATPLPPAPANGYCFDSFTTPNYNGVRECPSAPPPFNPPNDPNALNTITGTFASHTCGRFGTNNGQNFGELFGRPEGAGAVINTWPYRPSTSVAIMLPPHGRYYGGVGQMPANPGTARHYLKADLYGGSCGLRTSPGARLNARVIPVGITPAFAGICSKTGAAADGGVLVTINPTGFNSAMCNVPIISTWRYVVENAGNTQITVILTYN